MTEPNERSEQALWQTLEEIRRRLEKLEQAVYKPAQESQSTQTAKHVEPPPLPGEAPHRRPPAEIARETFRFEEMSTSYSPPKEPAKQTRPEEAFAAATEPAQVQVPEPQTTAPAQAREPKEAPAPSPEQAAAHAPAPQPQPATARLTPASPAASPPIRPHPLPGKLSLEQRLGTRWTLFVGLALLVLTAVFTFQYITPYISEGVRLLIGAAVGVAMVGLGEYWRRKLRLFAAGISAGGIVLLYLVVFVASRNGAAVLGEAYHKLSDLPAFLCMCAVTLLGIAAAVRNGLLLSGVLSLIGALATPILMSTGKNAQAGLLTYLLLVNIGFLAMAIIQNWQALAPLALAGTAVVFTGWFHRYGHAADSIQWMTTTFAWSIFGLYVLYGLLAVRMKRAATLMSPALLLAAMVLMGCLWVGMDHAGPWLLTQMLVLNVTVLCISLRRRWLGVAALAMIQSVVLFVAAFDRIGGDAGTASFFGWSHAMIFAMFALLAPRFFGGGDGVGRITLAAATVLLGTLWVNLHTGPTALLVQLLVLDAIVLAVAMWKQWQELSVLALAETAVILIACFDQFRGHHTMLNIFGWSFAGLFVAYALAAWRWNRAQAGTSIGMIASACPLLVLLWLSMDTSNWTFMLQLAAIDLAVVGICLWARWNWLRAGAIAWTALGLAVQYVFMYGRGRNEGGGGTEWFWSPWIWAFFAILTTDLLVRAWRRQFSTNPDLDAYLAGACNTLMYATTYFLLNPAHHAWMGLYTFALGAAAIALAWIVRCRADRRALAYAYFGSGLTLVTLAMPIQFSFSTLTLAWAIQSVVLMLLAKRLAKPLLLAASVVVLTLAICHFAFVEMATDPDVANVLLGIGGVAVTLGLVLALSLTAACLIVAATLGVGKAVVSRDGENVVAYTIAAVGVLIFGLRTATELPIITSTWWWLALSCGIAAAALVARSAGLVRCSLGLLLVVVGKWMLCDTLGQRLAEADIHRAETVVFNWQFFAGLALAAALLAMLRRATALGFARLPRAAADDTEAPPEPPAIPTGMNHFLVLLAAALVVWGGSFEVDRYFNTTTAFATVTPVQQDMARQMGYCLWWALYALATLAVGFAVRRAPLRWFAIILLALSLALIVVMILYYAQSIYKIAALAGVSLLVLTAAWLYNRYFRKAKPDDLGPQMEDHHDS